MPRKTFTYGGQKHDLTAKTPEELAVKIAMRMRDIDEGKTKISGNMTVDRWFDEYMITYKEKNISEETWDDYYSRYNSKISPHIGKMKVKDVKEAHCQKVINAMFGNSDDYIGKVNRLMYNMFKRAKKNHLCNDNPAEDLEIIQGIKDGNRRGITDIERKYIYIVAAYHRGGLWLKTILLAGLRPQETAALQGMHLEFDKDRIRIEKAVKAKGNRIGDPKTDAGVRYAPMPPELKEEFLALNLGPFDYVFTNTRGERLSKKSMNDMWHSFKREMNIHMGCKVYRSQVLPLNWEAVLRNGMAPIFPVADDLVPYCCRHQFATDMRNAGISIDDAMPVMGHEDAETTWGYTDESEEAFKRVQVQLAAYQKQANPINKVG